MEIPKTYNPSDYENKIYKKWEEDGLFKPQGEGEPFSVMMPPPNVTGVLHLGHALENALMDTMVRYERLKGKRVLLVPGTDHAAVATQARVEKLLVEGGMKNPREELGREKLLEKIREYAENSKTTIINQVRRMGTSCDWSRLAYTFDEKRNKAVNTVFKKMYDDGLIYRGYRVVNWSVKGQSTCSDDELVHVEQPGKLYTFKYAKDFPMEIATSRPETKLGDTAVAVNPKDKRYKKYIGQTFNVDFCGQKLKLKIIASQEVDMGFGTGALGVTPAHSQIDFAMYEKEKAAGNPIDLIPVIDGQGKMTSQAGEDFAGLTVQDARAKVVERLKKDGLFIKEEDIVQNMGTSDRFGDVVEAIPMTQWFVDVNREFEIGRGKLGSQKGRKTSLKQLMKEAVTTGLNGDKNQKINITPDRFGKVYLQWIDNLRDWCISRQIWWGHRLPVWYKRDEGRGASDEVEDIYVGERAPAGEGWVQDEDTLDTWFSSGLWPFSTLGWPEKTEDLKTFFPTSWIQMGYEILFFWMARMILMASYVQETIPFKDVYIHGILRNAAGKKFSKSSGNNIDPLILIDKYGTDALRWGLITGNTPGNDMRFYEEKIEDARNMMNKLWNISRFVLMTIEEGRGLKEAKEGKRAVETMADRWILSRFNQLKTAMTKSFEEYNFSQAGEDLRDFTWNELADWYLEIAKVEGKKEVILFNLLKDLLKLWHPFAPFVTEAIWQYLGLEKQLMAETWPKTDKVGVDEKAEKEMALVQETVIKIRNMRAEFKVEPAKKIKLLVKGELGHEEVIKALARLESISQVEVKPEKAVSSIIGKVELYLPLADLIDQEKEKSRLSKEKDNLTTYIKGLKAKLKNKEFSAKAPGVVVEAEKAKLAEAEEKLEKVAFQLLQLN